MKKVIIEFDSYLELSEIESGLKSERKLLKELEKEFPNNIETHLAARTAIENALAKIQIAKNEMLK